MTGTPEDKTRRDVQASRDDPFLASLSGNRDARFPDVPERRMHQVPPGQSAHATQAKQRLLELADAFCDWVGDRDITDSVIDNFCRSVDHPEVGKLARYLQALHEIADNDPP